MLDLHISPAAAGHRRAWAVAAATAVLVTAAMTGCSSPTAGGPTGPAGGPDGPGGPGARAGALVVPDAAENCGVVASPTDPPRGTARPSDLDNRVSNPAPLALEELFAANSLEYGEYGELTRYCAVASDDCQQFGDATTASLLRDNGCERVSAAFYADTGDIPGVQETIAVFEMPDAGAARAVASRSDGEFRVLRPPPGVLVGPMRVRASMDQRRTPVHRYVIVELRGLASGQVLIDRDRQKLDPATSALYASVVAGINRRATA